MDRHIGIATVGAEPSAAWPQPIWTKLMERGLGTITTDEIAAHQTGQKAAQAMQ